MCSALPRSSFSRRGARLYFFANYAAAVQSRLRASALNPVLHLARIAFWACLAGSGIVFAFLSVGRDFSVWLGWPLVILTALLILDPLARAGLRFYQPRTLRGIPGPAGNSLLLDAVFGRGHGIGGAIRQFEHLVGAKVSEMWMLRFLRQTFGIILAAALLLGWFSTCLTAVPAGSRGVSVLLGRYQEGALNPGLHFTFPWPIQEVEIVQTEMVRSISLGFDKDIPGPVLWNEPHAEGERNLLVGNGESLLTISVPILYRIADPVAYLKTAKDVEEALSDLAERKLMLVVGSRDSFDIMTEGREEIAGHLKKIVAGGDRPVAARPGDRLCGAAGHSSAGGGGIGVPGRRERAGGKGRHDRPCEGIPGGRAAGGESLGEPVEGSGAGKLHQKVSQAAGEAARFSAIVFADKENPTLFRTRLRLDTMESSLGKSVKTIIGIRGAMPREFYIDLRNTSELPPP